MLFERATHISCEASYSSFSARTSDYSFCYVHKHICSHNLLHHSTPSCICRKSLLCSFVVCNFNLTATICFIARLNHTLHNLHCRRQFAASYPEGINETAVSQILWGHSIILIQKTPSSEMQQWHTKKTIKNGWMDVSLFK